MSEQFGDTSADKDAGSKEGTGFGSTSSDQDKGSNDSLGMTSEELLELQKRDRAAQAHIEQLESENAELREAKANLSNDLASSETLQEVLARMEKDPGEPQQVDLDQIASKVEEKLQEKVSASVADSNWEAVINKLTETYGSAEAGDAAVVERANKLQMGVDEASDLARRNPTAFFELFLPVSGKPASTSPHSASKGDAAAQMRSGDTSNVRDRAFYNDMRRTNPNKYWSVENQEQLRRDLYGTD